MSSLLRRMGELFRELKRRHVFKVAGAYAVVALLVVQVTSHIFPALLFPEWTQRLVVILAMLGFPVALVLAWAFEMTPEGVRPTSKERSAGAGHEAEESRAVSRAVAVGITAGLLTVVGFGLWTAGWDPTGAMDGGPKATADSTTAVAGESGAPSVQATAGGGEEEAEAGFAEAESSSAGAEASSAEAAASSPEDAAGSEPSTAARDGAETRTSSAGATEEPAPTSGVVVLVRGSEYPGHRTVESVLLGELRSAGFEVADRTSLELRADAESTAPGEMGRRAGTAVAVTAEFRAQASQQVRGFYTGTATLSVRAYDTASGDLLLSETFSVGGDTPGEMASTPDAAATKAAEKLAHQAASSLRRELGDRLDEGD